jgi:hypothetical protein
VRWYLTVIDPAANTVLFGGNSIDRVEIEAAAPKLPTGTQPRGFLFARRWAPRSSIGGYPMATDLKSPMAAEAGAKTLVTSGTC